MNECHACKRESEAEENERKGMIERIRGEDEISAPLRNWERYLGVLSGQMYPRDLQNINELVNTGMQKKTKRDFRFVLFTDPEF